MDKLEQEVCRLKRVYDLSDKECNELLKKLVREYEKVN